MKIPQLRKKPEVKKRITESQLLKKFPVGIKGHRYITKKPYKQILHRNINPHLITIIWVRRRGRTWLLKQFFNSKIEMEVV